MVYQVFPIRSEAGETYGENIRAFSHPYFKATFPVLGTDLVHKTDQQQLIQGTTRQETCAQENCTAVERKTILALETDS